MRSSSFCTSHANSGQIYQPSMIISHVCKLPLNAFGSGTLCVKTIDVTYDTALFLVHKLWPKFILVALGCQVWLKRCWTLDVSRLASWTYWFQLPRFRPSSITLSWLKMGKTIKKNKNVLLIYYRSKWAINFNRHRICRADIFVTKVFHLRDIMFHSIFNGIKFIKFS